MSDALAAALMATQRRRIDPIEQQRRYAQMLLQQGASMEPVRTPLAGLARALTGGIGGAVEGLADMREKSNQTKTADKLGRMLSASTPDEIAAIAKEGGGDMEILAPVMATMITERQKQMRNATAAGEFGNRYQGAPPAGTPAIPGMPGGQGGPVIDIRPNPPPVAQGSADPAATAVAGIESRGQPNGGYAAVGPSATPQGNRAYGKYQVMDFNIGPWTKEILGQEMTPEQFVANPQAQDVVFKAKFDQYRQQYGGDEPAFRAWFAGPGGMNNPNAKDVNGVTVAQYSQKAQAGMPQGGGDANGNPVPQQVGMPPDVPMPKPTSEQIKRYQNAISSGAMTPAQAEQELHKELTQQWTVDRETRRLVWQQGKEDERITKKAQADLTGKAPMEMIVKRVDNYEKEIRPKGEAAVQEINSIHQVRQLLDAGIFSGAGADAQAFGSRVAQALGLDWGADTQANTAALQSAVGNRVLALVKNLGAGTGISNADREYAAKIAGGEISVGEPAMRKILDIGERAARATIKAHDAEAERTRKLPGMNQLGEEQFKLPPAPTYKEWASDPANAPKAKDVTVQAAPPGAPAQQAQPQGIQEGATATHPQTGQKAIFRNGQWVDVQTGAALQ